MPSTIPAGWGGPLHYDFVLESSGSVCKLRKIDIMEFLEKGILSETDQLAGIVQKHIDSATQGKGPKKVDKNKMGLEVFKDPKSMAGTGDLIFKVVQAAVVEPALEFPPDNYEDRKEGVVYIDTVPFPDRLQIFSHVMQGVNALKSLRVETDESVANVDNVPSLSQDAG